MNPVQSPEKLTDWRIVLQKPSVPWRPGERCTFDSESCRGSWQGDQCRLHCGDTGVEIELARVAGSGGTIWSAQITNTSTTGWFVREFAYPVLRVTPAPGESLIWPHGLGRRFANPTSMSPQVLDYPSGSAPMPWFTFNDGVSGTYYGSHDSNFSARRIEAVPDGTETLALSWTHSPFCRPGQTWAAPPLHVTAYAGSWHRAAERYREWFNTIAQPSQPPAWVTNASGWLLAVLKQQNGHVMWDYRTGIDRLCDVAQKRGLDVLGLFGWAHGGHDALYPDYNPDGAMGGEQALREALIRVRQRGMRAILYANGNLMDTATEFYREQGNDVAALREDTEPYVDSIRKFHSHAPVTFAKGCHGSRTWRRRMIGLARQAADLGADGILFDQVAVLTPLPCFSKAHLHATPATAFTTERIGMLREIEEAVRREHPDFVIATEGVCDALCPHVQFWHGWGYGFGPHQTGWNDCEHFPELVRYTFPEWVVTNRYSQPVLAMDTAAFAVLHGMRLELESRYQADVDSLVASRCPTEEDYADVAYWPPDMSDVFKALHAGGEAETKRMQAIMAFVDRNRGLLREGRFLDVEGFTLANPLLRAKLFEHGTQLGVVLWNPTSQRQSAGIVIPNADILGADTPVGRIQNPQSEMQPDELRLIVAELRS